MRSKFLFAFIIVAIYSCTKTVEKEVEKIVYVEPVVCDVRGTYSGTASSGTSTSPMVYYLAENNLAKSSTTIGGTIVTYGGYRNTCDSVIISARYISGNADYLLKGKLTDGRTKLSGTFQNLTNTSDFGTFTLTKQ